MKKQALTLMICAAFLTGCAAKTTTTTSPTGATTTETTSTTTEQTTLQPGSPGSIEITQNPGSTTTTTTRTTTTVDPVEPAAGGSSSETASSTSAAASSETVSFLTEATEDGQEAAEVASLAAQKSSNPEVKQFAQTLVSHHSEVNAELARLDSQKGVTVPEDADGDATSSLTGLVGLDFDRAFIDQTVSDHQSDIEEFQDQAQTSEDPDVKAFASKTLPALQAHLETAKSLQTKLSNTDQTFVP